MLRLEIQLCFKKKWHEKAHTWFESLCSPLIRIRLFLSIRVNPSETKSGKRSPGKIYSNLFPPVANQYISVLGQESR